MKYNKHNCPCFGFRNCLNDCKNCKYRELAYREGKMVNKQEVTAAIQEKHQETIEKLNRLWEQYNKEFNENPRKCNKEEYVQKSEYLLGYCSGLMEVCRILVQDIK